MRKAGHRDDEAASNLANHAREKAIESLLMEDITVLCHQIGHQPYQKCVAVFSCTHCSYSRADAAASHALR